MDLVIDRSKWLRGEPNAGKLLRTDDGKMCCLGFFSRACGLSDEQIADLGEPQEPFAHRQVDGGIPDAMKFLVTIEKNEDYDPEWDDGDKHLYGTSRDAEALMAANDDQTLPEEDRETQIAAIFETFGVRVMFVDDATCFGCKAVLNGAVDECPRHPQRVTAKAIPK